MRHVIIGSFGVILLVSLVLTLGGGPIVEAQADSNEVLEGDYKYSARVTCARDSEGFDETNDFEREGGGFTVTLSVQGDVHYDDDGTGHFEGQRLTINHRKNAAGEFPIGQADLDCDLTDTVNADGTFTELRACTATFTAGPRDGQMQTFSFTFQGVIGDEAQLLLLSDTAATEDPISDSGDLICNRSAIAIKIGVENDDG